MTDHGIRSVVDAWGSWGPSMTPDAARVAYVSDRHGVPEVWVQDIVTEGELPEPLCIPFDDPVVEVSWSADSRWLAVMTATDGGVRTRVWVVRPDGTGPHLLAGDEKVHAVLGPWTRSGHRVVITIQPQQAGRPTEAFLADPATGGLSPLVTGPHVAVLDLSAEERFVVIRDGRRGEEYCAVVDRVQNTHLRLAEGPGSSMWAFIRPAPGTWDVPAVAYSRTEAGLDRISLVASPIGSDGRPGAARVLATREHAELEMMDADDAGSRLLLVWNVGGHSEIEIFIPATGERTLIPGLPGSVVSTPVLSRDGDSVLVAVEDAVFPRELWHVDTVTHRWTRVAGVPQPPDAELVSPEPHTFTARDGLELHGWLYRVPGRIGPGPAVVFLHGGPESQERPTFSAQKQAMVQAGYAVFAPNVRGSGGQGRLFSHLDDVDRRPEVFDDVIAARDFLVSSGVAFADRIAVVGRAYGGFLALSALAFSPGVYAAGIDLSGISDLSGFFRGSDPWIADMAIPKYGHPRHDRRLFRAISPLRKADAIREPLLIVHGVNDTNVPITESRGMVSALQRLGRDVEYLELAGEGHEYRRAASHALLIERMLGFLGRTIGAPRA
jgi:dipeptidyl aminopeptidase/acylaminoacyl peptidase